MNTIKDMRFKKYDVVITYRSGNVISHFETDKARAARKSGHCSHCDQENELTPLFQYLHKNDPQPAVVDWVCCE